MRKMGGRLACSTGFKKDGGWWAGKLLETHFGCNDKTAKRILVTWEKNGVIERTTYRHPEQRKQREGILVNENKRPGKAVS
jgi:hypothetical protein